MRLELVDRNRNVVFPGRGLDATDKFGALRALMASCKASSENKALEFVMDREFHDAVVAQAVKYPDAKIGESQNALIEMQDGRNAPSFMGSPIVVLGD